MSEVIPKHASSRTLFLRLIVYLGGTGKMLEGGEGFNALFRHYRIVGGKEGKKAHQRSTGSRLGGHRTLSQQQQALYPHFQAGVVLIARNACVYQIAVCVPRKCHFLSSRIMGLHPVPSPDSYPSSNPILFITRHLDVFVAIQRWSAEGSVLRVCARILSVTTASTGTEGGRGRCFREGLEGNGG
jgi:hypothetical protein